MHTFLLSTIQALLIARETRRGDFKAPSSARIVSIRQKLGLSQAQFSRIYGFELDSLQSWEQGRRKPDQINSLLLELVHKYPDEMRSEVREAEGKRAILAEELQFEDA